ncbi:MAG: hypothetical protein WCJ03_02620 [Bacteroidales bacterium]
MRTTTFITLLILMIIGTNLSAQRNSYSERYGNTLNLGIGIGGYSGYYGYVGRSLPVLHANYEFDVANNITLAPFLTYFTYTNNYYHETVIPIGVKGTYYFDNILNASPKWDYYLAGSLGFALVNSNWDNNYQGVRNAQNASPLFLDIHVGTEYHLTKKLGIFLDLSSGVSTIGLSLH